MKRINTTERLRKNPYIITTFALALLCIIMVIGNIIEAKSINKTEDEILCSVISGTPAWVVDGKIIQYGAIMPENQSIDLVNSVLIPDNIKMLYSSDCSACKAQIDYFNNQVEGSWEQYQKEGLAIDCSKI